MKPIGGKNVKLRCGWKEHYFDAAWSEEKVVKVPLAIPLHIASVSSDVSRRGGEQTAFAPCKH